MFIIYIFRPDLIDFRRVQTQSNRQNLELAFSTAEREFGVTRLLDPEGKLLKILKQFVDYRHKQVSQ